MNTYGYVRVSAKDQNEERQLIALADAGVDEKNIYVASNPARISTGHNINDW